MTDQAPNLADPIEEFSLELRSDTSLSGLVEEAAFDDVHFFLAEAIAAGDIVDEPDYDGTFALVPYSHEEHALNQATFELLADKGWTPATLRDLLCFAIARPQIQREHDVIALGTLRTRRVYTDRPGETVWDQTDLDRSICQWAVGLSALKTKRTLVPLEIFLGKVLRQPALLLVRTS